MKQTPMFLMLLLATALSTPAHASAGASSAPDEDKRKAAPTDATDSADATAIRTAHRTAA